MDPRINIMLAGVGGQGLVLTTDIICEIGFRAGYDVKSNDVVGLSQRGGKVWGSVRMGNRVYSPNISEGHADYLIALEPLEGLRWQDYLRPGGKIILNTTPVYPVYSITGDKPYPHDFLEKYRGDVDVASLDATAIALEIGNSKMANIILLGILAVSLPFPVDLWKEVISERVPPKYLDMNIKGFMFGYENG